MTHSLVLRRAFAGALTTILWSSAAHAQATPPAPAAAPQSSFLTVTDDRRPATTSFLGDTGIWYVPTAEVLQGGTWSVGGSRRGTNYVQGSSNVADFAGSVAVGIGQRVEVFGAFLFDTRINRDDRPVFADEAREGGIAARYPRVNQSWTGNNVGDLYVGTKVNLLSEYRRAPMALAVRGMIKVPTGDDDAGVSTGKTDVMADVIASKEIARFFEVATYAGYERRGEPDGFNAPAASYRWGTGVAFPSRSPLRLSAEVNGDLPSNYRATLTDNSVVGDDGSQRPFESDIRNRTRATGGITYQLPAGFYMGTGLSWNAPRYWDWQVRIGYHGRGRDIPRALAPATPAAPVYTPAPAVEAPVAVGMPAPPAPPPAPVLVAAPAPVQAAAPTSYTFDDVYFDLDGYTLRPEGITVLDGATRAMQTDPRLHLNIEGHTCDLATSEYNIALSDRRANAVRDYFISRGIAASRLRTATYGEEDPEHANTHEAARQLNRRVALVVRFES